LPWAETGRPKMETGELPRSIALPAAVTAGRRLGDDEAVGEASLQIDLGSILDKEFTMVIYKVCTNIKMICTHNIPQLKKILNFQKCHLLSKCLRKS
jgi:hypothetical protein